uniref:Bifunctional lysine-specific demethylase and histidyl-hydroxylase n=1 Tax=Culicoides sonorensis TaxID=179676 RepID=A0A336L1S4_CULSO
MESSPLRIKKNKKKKSPKLDKSALVNEIINEQQELKRKKKDKNSVELKPSKKMKKVEQTNGNANNHNETIQNFTINFNNGLKNVSTPVKLNQIPSKKGEIKSSEDSIESGKNMFQWVIDPIKVNTFMEKHWEKKYLHVKRSNPDYYKHLMSITTIDTILKNNDMEYTKNIDITSYVNGERDTKNPSGRAKSSEVWDFYEEGCSIRILNPQTYIPEVYKMDAVIQEYFHCMTGTNVYLTPPNSQGFAPHYDDIEAFVLQVEGKKHWRLYNPRNENEVLPRESSENFDQSEIGSPILDVILEPGDLLYFPRGFIHQANTVPGFYSLHITLSVYQKQSYGDFFEQLVAGAVQETIENDVEFRQGLPLDFHRNLGLVYSDQDNPRRKELIDKIKRMFKKLADNLPIDDAADKIAKNYQHDALPPYLSEEERKLTTFSSDFKVAENGGVEFGTLIEEDSQVKLLKANILRMVTEENAIRLYYHVDNSKVYHDKDPLFLEIDEIDSPSVAMLINEYPNYVTVSELHEESERAVAVAQDLYDCGLLMKKPDSE